MRKTRTVCFKKMDPKISMMPRPSSVMKPSESKCLYPSDDGKIQRGGKGKYRKKEMLSVWARDLRNLRYRLPLLFK
ncbi:hypothetical protein GHT06_007885 [Daphnia sinensis]|uniref:Uncharacterized protein n=1 Tax=Daphnia sinensis TaxID=1820382 RepID=A0AAD5L124_9CRUS|nr:hypothetical protein GHT06_007885 [Daphnia sinensis]